jgi:hypothetical protein
MDWLGFFGVVFGAAGLGLAFYSQVKQKKFEKQLERKEELRALSEQLEKVKDLEEPMNMLVSNPFSHEDLDLNLRSLGRDVLAQADATDGVPIVRVSEVSVGHGDSKQVYESPDQVLQALKDGKLINVVFIADGNYDNFDRRRRYRFGRFLCWPSMFYRALDEIEKKNEGLVEQFSPELSNDIESTLDRIVVNLFDNIFLNKDGIEFDPVKYENADELGKDVLIKFLSYDGIEEDMEDFSELSNNVENVRTTVLQASYS